MSESNLPLWHRNLHFISLSQILFSHLVVNLEENCLYVYGSFIYCWGLKTNFGLQAPLSCYLIDGLLYALVIFVVLDYITGICAAIQAKHLSSNIGAKGIAKKVAIFLVISVAHVADQYLVDSTDVLRSMTTLFYLSNEGISIFENIGKIGIPLPGKLNNLLSRFEDIKNQMK